MKKSFYAIAAFAAILVGCSKEVEPQTPEIVNPTPTTVTLHAILPADSETKVSSDNAGAYAWQAGDKITALNTEGDRFEFVAIEGESVTNVDFNSSNFTGTLGTEAFYPASANHASGKFYLNPSFDWIANASFMPMLGTIDGTDQSVEFRTVGAVLKLICFNVSKDADQLIVTSNGKQISGQFTPETSGDNKIITAASTTTEADRNITISFATAAADRNMVFYIPLPTGEVGKLSFTVMAGATKLFEKQTKGAVTMTRNQVLVAPALNLSEPAADATLTNAEIVAKAWSSGSYATDSIENSSGTWNFNAAYAGNYSGSGKYYMQLRSNETVSYLQLPTFSNDIASIILHSVCNASDAQYSGSIYFRQSANNNATAIATAPATTKAKEDLTMEIPEGYTTGYIMVSAACRIAAFTVKFRGSSYTAPTLTSADALEIAVAEGNKNSATMEISLANAVDELGVGAKVSEDWLTASISGNSNPYTLTVSADKNTNGVARSAEVILRATGVKKVITVTQPSAIVADPLFSVEAGEYTATQNVEISCATEGASIRYTVDGTAPSETVGTLYTGAISVAEPQTIKAIAYKANYTSSSVVTKVYTFKVVAPTFTVDAGTYNNDQSVELSSETTGATIKYTTDGTEPSATNGTVYESAITVSSSQTIKAFAYMTGYTNSEVVSNEYTLKVATPSIVIDDEGNVTITCDTKDATIHYTIDGTTTPTSSSATYDEPFSVGDETTVKAIAMKSGYNNSEVAEGTYSEDTIDYTTMYTTSSNCSVSSNFNDYSVVIGNNSYTCAKANKAGTFTITIPQNTSKVHLFIAAWNNENCTVTVEGGTMNSTSITADSGVSGSATSYTLNGTISNYYRIITPSSSSTTTIKITLPSNKRGVVWGVNEEI